MTRKGNSNEKTYQIHRETALATTVYALIETVTACPDTFMIAHRSKEQCAACQ